MSTQPTQNLCISWKRLRDYVIIYGMEIHSFSYQKNMERKVRIALSCQQCCVMDYTRDRVEDNTSPSHTANAIPVSIPTTIFQTAGGGFIGSWNSLVIYGLICCMTGFNILAAAPSEARRSVDPPEPHESLAPCANERWQ